MFISPSLHNMAKICWHFKKLNNQSIGSHAKSWQRNNLQALDLIPSSNYRGVWQDNTFSDGPWTKNTTGQQLICHCSTGPWGPGHESFTTAAIRRIRMIKTCDFFCLWGDLAELSSSCRFFRKTTVPWQSFRIVPWCPMAPNFTYGRTNCEMCWHIGGGSRPCWWSIQHWFTRLVSSLHNLQLRSPSQDEQLVSMQFITSWVKMASVQILGGCADCRCWSQHIEIWAMSSWQSLQASVASSVSQLQKVFMQLLTSSPHEQVKRSSPAKPEHEWDSSWPQISGSSTLW